MRRRKQTINPDASALEAVDVHKVYRLRSHEIPVLNGVSLSVQNGEWLAMTGPSGSGKTTLLHLLGALDEPTHGVICCRGRDLRRLSAIQRADVRRRELGLVFQAFYLFPELNALENVMMPALRWGSNKKDVRQRAGSLLESFGLQHRLEHRPLELSGGEQQRVALARALINNPDIILADEPTGNLDESASRQIIDILQDLHRRQGKTIVMVTHNLALAEIADRRIKLALGQAVPAQTP